MPQVFFVSLVFLFLDSKLIILGINFKDSADVFEASYGKMTLNRFFYKALNLRILQGSKGKWPCFCSLHILGQAQFCIYNIVNFVILLHAIAQLVIIINWMIASNLKSKWKILTFVHLKCTSHQSLNSFIRVGSFTCRPIILIKNEILSR